MSFSNILLAESIVKGVHVRYQRTHPADIGSQEENEQVCQLYFKKKFRVVGDIEKVKQNTTDEYYSADGAYMAKYTKGYSLDYQDNGCQVGIVEYNNIQIYHIKTLEHYSYSSKRKQWKKHKMSNMSIGGKASLLLEDAFKHFNGTPSLLGDDRVAGLGCKRYTLKERAWCEWKKVDSNYKGLVAPQSLVLDSQIGKGKHQLISRVEFVNFKAGIDAKLFKAPEHYVDIDQKVKPKSSDDPYAWCRAQKKKTGKNPCDGMEDE